MNKKFKIMIALTLIIQLLIPVSMLCHHVTVKNITLNHSTEYKFKLLDMDFYGYNKENGEIMKDGSLYFEVGGVHNYYGEKIAVTVGEDGFVDLAEPENIIKTNCWFDYYYCNENSHFKYGEFSFEPDVDVEQLKKEINETYGWASNFHENGCYAYVTAKVYMGMFIPTAIYVKGEKVITIHQKN